MDGQDLRFKKMIQRLEPAVKVSGRYLPASMSYRRGSGDGDTYMLHWSITDAIKDLQNNVDKQSVTMNLPLFKLLDK